MILFGLGSCCLEKSWVAHTKFIQANVFFSKDDEKQKAKWNFQWIFRKLQPFRYLNDHLHMTVDNRHYDAYFK